MRSYGNNKKFQIGNGMKRLIIKSSDGKSNYIENIGKRYNKLDDEVGTKVVVIVAIFLEINRSIMPEMRDGA